MHACIHQSTSAWQWVGADKHVCLLHVAQYRIHHGPCISDKCILLGAAAEEQKPRLPWLRVCQLTGLWGSFLALQLVKSHFTRCQGPYFVVFGMQALLAATSSAYFTWQVMPAIHPFIQLMVNRIGVWCPYHRQHADGHHCFSAAAPAMCRLLPCMLDGGLCSLEWLMLASESADNIQQVIALHCHRNTAAVCIWMYRPITSQVLTALHTPARRHGTMLACKYSLML